MRIGFCLLAVALLAAQAPRPSFAEDAAPSPTMKDLGPIDTPGGAPIHHRDADRDIKPKLKFGASANPRARPAAGQAIAPRVTRNAIGVAVPAHDGNAGRDTRPESSVVSSPPAAPSVNASHAVAAVKTEEDAGHTVVSRPNIPAVTAPVAVRGTINGSGLIHRVSGPAVIGGQSKMVTGINGSMIHPKH